MGRLRKSKNTWGGLGLSTQEDSDLFILSIINEMSVRRFVRKIVRAEIANKEHEITLYKKTAKKK